MNQSAKVVLLLYTSLAKYLFFPAVNCGSLTDPDNGQVDISSGTTYGRVAIFSCNTGYELSNQQEVLCGEEGMWSSTSPSCLGKN